MTGEIAAGLLAAVALAGFVVALAMADGLRRRSRGRHRPATGDRARRAARDHLDQLAAQQVPYPPLCPDPDSDPDPAPPALEITWRR